MKFPHLFVPGKIGTLHLPNRILMGSMHLGYEGLPGGAERMAEFYAARARGGAALIITGGCAINPEAIGGANFSCIYKDEDVDSLHPLVSRVHEEGGRIGLQLFHAGRYASRDWLNGVQPVAPSPIRSTLHPGTPREMSEEDILRTIRDFAQAALRAQEIGFDCVEVMGSEGYLINQFLSPFTNRRNDSWGGSLENRCSFGKEVMIAIRNQCGPDFPVIYRMSGIDLMPLSSSWEETYYFASTIEKAGADALNIGIGWHESRIPTISMLVPRAYYSFAPSRIRAHVRIPTIASNRINDAETAERVLERGDADFVSMARALLSDPELPRKSQSGRDSFVNTCIACNQACLDNAFRNQPTTCILNPEAGREQEMKLQPATHRKNVAVVGAGPSGMEAAKVLAQRGHRVTLFERNAKLGGQLLHAALIPGKQEFYNTLRYYSSYLNELQVAVEFGHSPSTSDLTKYDAVVLATGARPNVPEINTNEHPHCMDYESFFNNPGRSGSRVVIVGAGGIGCDIAHLLSDAPQSYPPSEFFNDPNNVANYETYLQNLPRSREVTITRRGKRIGEKLGPTTRWALIQLLEKRGVQMLTQIQYEAITNEGLRAISRSGKEIFVAADTVIFATGQVSNRSYIDELSDKVEQCFLTGAAHHASETNCQSAIWEASEIARKI